MALTIPASNDCHQLVRDRTEEVAACATVTTAKGTVTAVLIESGHNKYVNVFRREGASAVLVLTGMDEGGTDGTRIMLGVVDPARDGDRKIAVVLAGSPSVNPPAASPPVEGYDLVDAPGVVTLHRSLGAGAVALVAGGLRDYATTGSLRPVTVSTLVYSGGAWRITSQQATASIPADRDTLFAAS